MENAWAALARIEADPAADVAELVSGYQLKPHLLDAVIPPALRALCAAYTAHSATAPLRTIYVFSRVRGHKTVAQHLPTDPSLLELLLARLQQLKGPKLWQEQYALLLWLAAVVLTPFELDALGEDLGARLYDAGTRFLGVSGIQRDAAAVLVAHLLTRKRADQARLVDRFVDGCAASGRDADGSGRSTAGSSVMGLGELQVVAEVMDRVVAVPPSVRRLVTQAMHASSDEKDRAYYGSMLTSRLWIKVAGRAALRDVANFAEFVIAECFALLDSKSTRVRMTAAKYIARVVARLPAENADEVVAGLIESLDEEPEYASPDYYNGALIALAELVRRRLITNSAVLNDMIVRVLEMRGLHFLQDRLTTQVGTNVRDAACYVCWSLFRSVPDLDPELRTRLFSSLIALAILDHEVNVRRAAAAALQEGLGRYGRALKAEEAFFAMEHLNFQSVSLVSHCYLDVAPLFCNHAHFFAHFMRHGVLNAGAAMRRLAAEAIPRLRKYLSTETMVDELLRAGPNESASAAHGRMLALAALYTSLPSQFRIADARKLIGAPTDSELYTEAVLRLVPIAPERASTILDAVVSEEQHVIAAAQSMCKHIPEVILYDEVLPVCVRKMRSCLTHVACIVAMPKVPTSVILQAARVANPQSRAMAVPRLDLHDGEMQQQLIAALNDYSVDDRGDVGGWVREAALDRVAALRPPEIAEITDALWRMASDSRQKLRLKAGGVLVQLKYVADLDFEHSEAYYYGVLTACPEPKRGVVAQGLAASVGGFNANAATAEGSFYGLVRFLDAGRGANDWVVQSIMGLDRSSAPRCAEVVRTLRRLVLHGVDVQPWRRVLAIAFNTTLVPRLPETLVADAVDILAVYAERSREATDRLVKLVKTHWSGRIRQSAADALFEAGVESDELETTDWTRRDFASHAQNLKINT